MVSVVEANAAGMAVVLGGIYYMVTTGTVPGFGLGGPDAYEAGERNGHGNGWGLARGIFIGAGHGMGMDWDGGGDFRGGL